MSEKPRRRRHSEEFKVNGGKRMSENPRRRRHSEEFKREVVKRMRECKNILGLGRELGLDVKMMYQWKWKQEGRSRRQPPELTTQAAKGTDREALRRENA